MSASAELQLSILTGQALSAGVEIAKPGASASIVNVVLPGALDGVRLLMEGSHDGVTYHRLGNADGSLFGAIQISENLGRCVVISTIELRGLRFLKVRTVDATDPNPGNSNQAADRSILVRIETN